MKRVSYKVAKAIKEAGYPQDRDNRTVVYPTKGEFKGVLCGYNNTAPERDKDSINAPTYLEVWFWLQSTRKVLFGIPLESTDDYDNPIYSNQLDDKQYTSPEEAIIAAIEYLVDNNLVK